MHIDNLKKQILGSPQPLDDEFCRKSTKSLKVVSSKVKKNKKNGSGGLELYNRRKRTSSSRYATSEGSVGYSPKDMQKLPENLNVPEVSQFNSARCRKQVSNINQFPLYPSLVTAQRMLEWATNPQSKPKRNTAT